MNASVKAPAHLWIVGGLSALWNAFGAYDYLMTQTANEAYLAQFTAEQRVYFETFPALMDAAWACGVWGALLGSLLLLMRSRHAVLAFGLSLAGLAVSTVYQYALSATPDGLMTGGMIALNVAIWIVAIALFVYAWKMRARGVLR